MGHCHTMADSRARQGIIDQETSALGVSDRIKAFDDFVFGVKNAESVIGLKPNPCLQEGRCL